MKNLILIIAITSGLTIQCIGQDYMKVLNEKDYATLVSYTNATINLEIDRNKSTEKSTVAINKVQEKLEAFSAIKWESVHRGASESKDAKYFIAEARNASGDGLRLFFHLETVGDKRKISSIRVRAL